jgi:hypothetical protein
VRAIARPHPTLALAATTLRPVRDCLTEHVRCAPQSSALTVSIAITWALLTGCGETPSGPLGRALPDTLPDNPFQQPDLLGTRLDDGFAEQVVWIPGSQRVVYVVRTHLDPDSGGDLRIADVVTGAVATLDTASPGGPATGSLAVSPDGDAVYYVAVKAPTVGVLRRLTLSTRTRTDLRPGFAYHLALNASGDRLAYVPGNSVLARDSVMVRDLTRGTDSLAARGYGIGGFSPDGNELLYDSSGSYRRLGLANHQAMPVPEIPVVPYGVAWTPRGIQYVFDTYVHDIDRRDSLAFWGNQDTRWSADGEYVVGWIWECIDFGCAQSRSELHVASRLTRRILVAARISHCASGGVALSFDARLLAYSVCDHVYWAPRP